MSSWLDKIKNELIITTGDGTQYRPSWLNATRQIEYHVAEFNFPNLPGTLVKRSEAMGRKYNVELYFQGKTHLDTSFAFEKSSANKKPWTLQHPFYGTIIAQPISLLFDNTQYNVTKITGTIIETITEDNPKTSADAIDTIKLQKEVINTTLEDALTATPTPGDINTMTANNNKNFKLNVPIITLPEEFETYNNLFNTASSAINNATASPLLAMRAVIAMINQPALFSISVKARIALLNTTFNNLRFGIENILDVSSKQIFQNSSAATLSAMCLAASNPQEGDYANGKSVLEIVEAVLAAYAQYLDDLDFLQTANGSSINSFIPDAESLIQLNNLITTTTSALFDIALNAKSERLIILEDDSNVIVLTHRFYGIENEANLDEFIANNNFGLDELIQIRKGTTIVYYI